VPAEGVVTLPDSLSFEVGASLGVVYVTAWMAVFDTANLGESDTAVVHGASGGVGEAIVQLASRLAHARVIAVVSSDDGAERARRLGASVTIDRTKEPVFDAIARHAAPHGPSVIFDVVGGEVFEQSVKALAPLGRVVTIGVSSSARNDVKLDLADFYRSNRRILGVGSTQVSSAARAKILARVVEHIARGEISAPPIVTLPLADAPDALRRTLEPHGVHGKIVLTV
jgi:NADPH2:quinone reductase